MRTLVISDLHLGQFGGISVLTRPRPLRALLDALDGIDRLVLLGDFVEMQETHPARSFPVAEPVLRLIAERLGPDRELLLVPGNHDHELVREWARARGRELAPENVVPLDASPELSRVVSWLEATRVEVHYPGLWLGDGVWATHGHYLSHYLRPVSTYGLHPRMRVAHAAPADFEYLGVQPEPELRDGMLADRWLDRHLPARLSRLTAFLLDRQMQRHALPAMAHLVQELSVEARYVVFGHVHRRGPREHDDPARWTVGDGGPRLLNTGCWRYEPVVVRGFDAASPYWPGGAVRIGDDGVPASIGLLDGLSERELVSISGEWPSDR